MTLDNQIDSTTGTSKLKAVFDNKDNTLFPQQFVNIRLLVDTLTNQLVVPNVAIQNGQQGTFVYVVDDGFPGAPEDGAGGITNATVTDDFERASRMATGWWWMARTGWLKTRVVRVRGSRARWRNSGRRPRGGRQVAASRAAGRGGKKGGGNGKEEARYPQ